ncbi:TetR/AcrR family transcriptional regulator [Aquimarina longa]|uniref:TetR/AcrR family transcriptional regulator n=1 Tax=Aquimarina longa TaxID=1080221 RepID=UPI0007817238|nr:TetR/AcrR family transcriptional regulator [Aquimarina longa]
MNKTKRKILDSSLKLYNTYGVSNVSQRRITEYLNISPGNLTYHFKKKEDIEEALYFELVFYVDELYTRVMNKDLNLSILGDFIDLFFELIYEYRFIFLDFVHLMKSNDKVVKHYNELLKLRQDQFVRTIYYLIDKGILRREELPDEYDNLYLRVQVFSDFYLSSVEILKENSKDEYKVNYKKTFMYSLYPFLTKEGKEEFKTII